MYINKDYKKKIVIIGAGWYGCHIASVLKDMNYDIVILESQDTIFNNSSYFNQNRLHLGFHYPRCFNTRNLCKANYAKFKDTYETVVDDIENNYYLISEKSIIDYTSYINIYKYEKFDMQIIENKLFNNVSNSIIVVNEGVINSEKVKNIFLEKLKDIDIKCNEKVLTYKKENDKIIINTTRNSFDCDVLLDCTYNQLCLSKKKYNYEVTISLVYKMVKDIDFNGITIMDGNFFSLYPRDIKNKIFTLTDVEYTPLIVSSNYKDIENFVLTNEILDNTINKMQNKILNYYSNFLDNFEYIDYFLSKKTKKISNSSSRDIEIEEIEDNVISVNCGKIYGIFEFEKYILEYLSKNV